MLPRLVIQGWWKLCCLFFSENFGNPSSRTHSFGWQAEEAVDMAREQVARLIGAEKNEIIFTSGATEAANLALKGVVEAYASKGNHIVTSCMEHKAVLDTCAYLEKRGATVTYLPVNSGGLIEPGSVEAAIRPDTVLIAIQFANNETGTLMPVREISGLARKKNVLLFSDGAQAVGKIPVDVRADGIDLLSLSGHKMYGPKGIGALYVRRKNPRVRLTPQMHGGGHEKGFRSGTLNVPAIVGLGKAAELCRLEMEADATRLKELRDRLENALLQVGEAYVNGDRLHRLPHVTNISFRSTEAEALMTGLSKEIALSSGSACTAASLEPSYVLKALGLDDEMAYSSLRFGLGRFTTKEEIDYVMETVTNAISRIRQESPAWAFYTNSRTENSVR